MQVTRNTTFLRPPGLDSNDMRPAVIHNKARSAFGMFNMKPVSKEEQASLEAICQQNGYLMRAGFDWQEDPYLEECPYEFDRCFSMDDLQDFFRHGNWAIRQGVVYGDLAFIQQENGGDDWWTLKQVGDGWMPFENVSFGRIAKDRSDLVRHIAGMRLATPEECRDLKYLPEKAGLEWSGNAFPYLDDGSVIARGENFLVAVEANYMGKMLTFKGTALFDIPEEEQSEMTLLQTINAQIMAHSERLSEQQSLETRAQGARQASEAQRVSGRIADTRNTSRQ